MKQSLIRNDINSIDAYSPGKPIAEVQRELGLCQVIKLASNENPLGPSPRAERAARDALSSVNRYPEGTCHDLKKKLARKLSVKEKNILLGNGSDELIDIILKTIKAPGAEILTADVTFVEYKISGVINGFAVTTVPLSDFKFNLVNIKRAFTKNTKAVFIANPNNPTGTYVTKSETRAFLRDVRRDAIVVFDEAYFEYVSAGDFPDLLQEALSNNVIVLRTFSKIYGLAGLRIGYMAAHEDFVRAAERVRQPFNVNTVAQSAALAALDDKEFVNKSRLLNLREKKRLYDAFSGLGIWYEESQTNFIFVRFNADAKTIFKALLQQGIIIRDMSQYGLAHYARITVGAREENTRLIAALKGLKGAL